MIDLPWRRTRNKSDEGSDRAEPADSTPDDDHDDAVVVCRFQDGTLAVYDDRVVVERVSRSRFDDREFSSDEIVGVDYDAGITIGYLQIELVGVDPDTGGLLSDPVNERTVHFGRGDRDCAARARDAILERARG
jgi:hypothetical protein